MNDYNQISSRGRNAIWPTVAIAALLVGGLSGCDGLLEVEVPGQMIREEVFDPTMAETVVISAVAMFECGYSALVPAGSGREDVWWRTSALYGGWAQYQEARAGTGGNCVAGGGPNTFYMAFQGGRALAQQIHETLGSWSDTQVQNRERLRAVAATYAGLTYQVFGEVFCETSVDVGPLMSQEQTLKEAERWFTIAIQQTGTTGDFAFRSVTSSVRQLAHLGRARVRFALGTRYAPVGERAAYLSGAAADASLIQPDFVAWVTRAGTPDSRRNAFYWHHNINTHGSIADRQPNRANPGQTIPFTGYRDLRIDAQGRAVVNRHPVTGTGVPDPRVPVEILTGHMGNDGQTQMYIQTKYNAYSSNIPLARWAEAQLILAEIEGGQSAVSRINALRDVHGLPHFSSTDVIEIRDAIVEERRREFFLENRFWADKLRYGLWFPRGVGLAEPTRRGLNGIVTCQLMPASEYDNNPNLRDGPDGTQHYDLPLPSVFF